MLLERSLQGRKLERGFPAGYSRNRGLGPASTIISVGEISRDFLSLNWQTEILIGGTSRIVWLCLYKSLLTYVAHMDLVGDPLQGTLMRTRVQDTHYQSA